MTGIPSTFAKCDRKNRLFKYTLYIGKKITKKYFFNRILFLLIKNFDFVNSHQKWFTVQNADIRICPI